MSGPYFVPPWAVWSFRIVLAWNHGLVTKAEADTYLRHDWLVRRARAA